MPDPKVITPKIENRLLPAPKWASARRQQRFMVVALALLLGALLSILYRDRDFWFPGTEQASDAPLPDSEQASDTPQQATGASTAPATTWTAIAPTTAKSAKVRKAHVQRPVQASPIVV